AVVVVAVGGGSAGLDDLGRQGKFRVPLGGDGSRLRRAVGFGARGFQAAVVALIGGDVAVGVGVLGQETGGVVLPLFAANGAVRARQGFDFRDAVAAAGFFERVNIVAVVGGGPVGSHAGL